MPSLITIDDIRRRAAALRLRSKEFASLAGLNIGTTYDAFEGRCRPRPDTVRKLSDALVAEELAQLKRLGGLHPDGIGAGN